jgi:hypothetical protein
MKNRVVRIFHEGFHFSRILGNEMLDWTSKSPKIHLLPKEYCFEKDTLYDKNQIFNEVDEYFVFKDLYQEPINFENVSVLMTRL